ncbi:MAG TPA: hypothetical protein PKK36_03210, partial [Kiritimatiellia bacterium]|nr:hypothetical protein [Kiritimatiellia bacterium]
KHGPQHLYFKAKGESRDSLEDARQNALKSVQAQIAEYIFAEVEVRDDAGGSRVSVESAVELRELESFKEDEAKSGGTWIVWMLGRYPRAEYDRIRKRLEMGVKLESLWQKAQSALNQQKLGSAEKMLLSIIKNYDKGLRVSFDVESVKLELAGLYLKQDRGLKARQFIADVQKSTTDSLWRRKADELFAQLPPVSLKDAFEGKTVGIVCFVGGSGRYECDANLASELNSRLAKYSVKTVHVKNICESVRPVIDDGFLKQIALKGRKEANVLFVAVMDVDSTKTGTKIAIPGTDETTDALDAKLVYWIVRSSDGAVLASDSTVGLSSAQASLLNTILTHRRHLPQYAPGIAEQLQK